ncbi:major type 1 subunit fimbrin (pilin) [Serratia fonticola]|jgi:major type 1 subunit fimbrin (pilin)|uniref:Major type 1 subunit fimbrin (Pilin) n=1 Tax=Serratia fonticola TaxID=47917 RepID=A0A559T4J8_SERFO|nr:fimbrial protein [Serratia fonticola]TQI77978.1 major type 1 subunit fimbrin (pilin) [Serratia fonticola]TQI95024.1 major type 1 subunit fimbrin (pilin) [Serratia fonticola]TVZ69522.1 major type 1 subunit fimbrin (pilin) [Serratia fonticola]
MKKNFAAVLMAMTLATTGSAFAADGTVEFTGKITDTACTIATPKVLVPFGTVASSSFAKVGDMASSKSFQIKLDDCPASTATVRFDAVQDGTNPDLFSIGNGSSAAGVGINLFDADNNVIRPNNDSGNYTLIAGSNTLDFVAKLKSTEASVTVGDILASADFTIVYQ